MPTDATSPDSPFCATAPRGPRRPPSPHGSEALKRVMWLYLPGKLPAVHAEPEGPRPSLRGQYFTGRSARHHPCPRGRKCCIVISERAWASFAGSGAHTRQRRQLPTSGAAVGWLGKNRAGRRPTRLSRGTLPASPSSWQREAGGKPSGPTASTHTLAGDVGEEWLASEAPARSWPLSSSSPFPLFALYSVREGDVAPGVGVLSQ